MTLNVLLITADDMDARTPSAFGGIEGVTPRLDRLAAEGKIFTRSHVPIAVCQPSRSAMMTGQWPHRNGAEGFQPINDDVTLLTDLLHEQRYVTGILGKVEHLEPVERFGWDYIRGMRQLGMGRDPRAYGASVEEFLTSEATRGAPWFLMVNAHDPHRPFARSEQEAAWSPEDRSSYPDPALELDPESIEVPGFLADLPEVRREFAEYLASARRCDDVVAETLAAVDRAGASGDTLVVFLSDNGMAFPFAKANCYLRSTLTPFIVRWPGHVAPGSRDDISFVSMLDLMPTFCDAIGIPVPDDVDGRSLAPLLRGGEDGDRDEVFTVFHETSAKRRFEMRCRQDGSTGYIWNKWSGGSAEYAAENMEGRSWRAMVAAAEADPAVAERVSHYRAREAEELYDLENDPDCLINLVGQSGSAERLAHSRQRMSEWLASTADPLAERYRDTIAAPWRPENTT